jgi:hypothetical protein
MVPLAKIKPREGFNPRAEFADEQMAELVESVRRHGIITPLTLAPEGEGFAINRGRAPLPRRQGGEADGGPGAAARRRRRCARGGRGGERDPR